MLYEVITKEKESMPIAVFKPTGFGRLKLFEKIGTGEVLTEKEQEEWLKVVNRFDTICKRGKENDIEVLIDAEETWMQDASDALVTEMMQKYNTEKPIVFNTLQMYRTDRLDFLKREHQLAKDKGYFMGFKLVRGAYLEKENERAKEKGYPTPMCKSKSETDANFDNAVSYILNNLNDISLFIGSHNEESRNNFV